MPILKTLRDWEACRWLGIFRVRIYLVLGLKTDITKDSSSLPKAFELEISSAAKTPDQSLAPEGFQAHKIS